MNKVNNLKQQAKIELGKWLNGMEWDLWTTLSTSYELTLPSARRSMIRFHEKVSTDNPATVFWAAEAFDVKDGFHTHSLWKFNKKIYERETYRQFVRDWRTTSRTDKAAVYSERYNANMGASGYLSKYITKSITDYDLFNYQSNHKEKINDNIQPFFDAKRNIIAKSKIMKLCKRAGVNYHDVKREIHAEWNEAKYEYENIEEIEKKLYQTHKAISYILCPKTLLYIRK